MAAQRHARGDFGRFLEVRAVRAHAKRFDVDDRPAFERGLALVGAGQRDARLDALLESRGARRVIAAERNAPHADAVLVDVGARFEIVDHGADGLLILGTDGKIVFGFALSRPVERERRETALQEPVLVIVHFLFRRIEAHAHDDDGALSTPAGLRRLP